MTILLAQAIRAGVIFASVGVLLAGVSVLG